MRNLTFAVSGTSAVMHASVPRQVEAKRAGTVLPVKEWPSFVREVFARLYRPSDEETPLLKPEDWAKAAHSLVTQAPDWAGLRRRCAGNALISGAATDALEAAVREKYPGSIDREDPAELLEQIRSLERMASTVGLNEDALEHARSELQATIARSQVRRHALQGHLEKMSDDGGISDAVSRASHAADEKASDVALLRGFGVEAGQHAKDAEVDAKLAKLLGDSDLLRSILEAMGAMLKAHKVRELEDGRTGRCDVVGVHPGRELSSLTTTERARLAHPTLRADLLRRAMDGAAMTWEMLGGEEAKNRGDIVVLLDRSGSMSGPRMLWARAIGGAVLSLAIQEKRRIVLVLFSHTAKAVVVDGAAKERSADVLSALSLLSEGADGGTDAPGAFREALLLVRPQQPPDILVVTDAVFSPADDSKMVELAKDARARRGVVTAILLGHNDDQAPWADESVVVMSECEIQGDAGSALAARILKRVVRKR